MHPRENEPKQEELEALEADEELQAVREIEVPAEVKSELLERAERFEETDLENERPDGPVRPI